MVAPAPDELSIVLDHLAFEQAAYITGGPGEGKSTLAFHAAREFFETGYNVYQLSVLSLNGYSREYLRDQLLAETDQLHGNARLIIVDDAHLLERPNDVKEILLSRREDGDTSIVWVSTDELATADSPSTEDLSVRINYARFTSKQAAFLENNVQMGNLESSELSLENASVMSSNGEINTAWQYSFVAYGGTSRLTAGLTSLSNLELFILFNLSARAVAIGELNLPMPTAQSILEAARIGWVRDDIRGKSYKQVIHDLSRRSPAHEQFLRMDATGASTVQVACLHYNFARVVVRESLNRTVVR